MQQRPNIEQLRKLDFDEITFIKEINEDVHNSVLTVGLGGNFLSSNLTNLDFVSNQNHFYLQVPRSERTHKKVDYNESKEEDLLDDESTIVGKRRRYYV